MIDNAIQQNLQIIKQQCQQKGLKLTTKRADVMKIMLAAKGALSAYDIADTYYAYYKKKYHLYPFIVCLIF